MSSTNISKLIEERTELLKELATLTQMLHGSFLERYSVCSRKNCKCRSGERHGPRYYVVVNINGKQKQKYIPITQIAAARKGIDQYKRLGEIVEEITQINLEFIKEGVYPDT